ncbi:MAG: hypothetical protein A2Z25_16840 [Planctomycetes bacterium RBG_16_55_9]|nr:MAG: hypothetical protein A2Z25_16840 [Planctomycetes bacterium RBG_16_55_9]
MKGIVTAVALTLLAGCQTKQNTTPIFTKIHTVSIHVKDHAVHDAVYRFLKDDLQLPVEYTPVTLGERKYAGLWAGNLRLEPCGPYSNLTYATPDFTAMFYGITFEAYESSDRSAAQLDQRRIRHEAPDAYLIISDPGLCGQNLVVSIMDNPDRDKEQAKHEALTSQLRANQGGPLGVQYVEEIQVGYTDKQDLDKWKTFMAPAGQRGRYRWQPDHGPVLRLVKSDLKEIKAVVFKVARLESAVRYLKTRNMLVDKTQNGVEVKTPDSWDFTIALQE